MRKYLTLFCKTILSVSLVLGLIASAFAHDANKELPESLVYAHLFRLVASLDKGEPKLAEFFRDQMQLDARLFEQLRVTSRKFERKLASRSGKSLLQLSVAFKQDLETAFGKRQFLTFDRIVKEKIITHIEYQRNADGSPVVNSPTTGYGSSISLGLDHTLIGDAYTVGFGFAPQDKGGTCSVAATMSGPGVSESGSDSAGCFERSVRVDLVSTAYQPNSHYCVNGVHSGGVPGTTGESSACLDTPPIPEPVIFIPGTMGSELYRKSTGVKYWMRIVDSHLYNSYLTLDPDSDYNIGEPDGFIAKDALRHVQFDGLVFLGPYDIPIVIPPSEPIPVYDPILSALVERGHFKEYDISQFPPAEGGCDTSQISSDPL